LSSHSCFGFAVCDSRSVDPKSDCINRSFSQNRVNLFWGLDWAGIPERLDGKRRLTGVDIVICCVDTRAARAAIAKWVDDWSEVDYWLDVGNNADTGQFVIGEPLNRRNRRKNFDYGQSPNSSRK
jgi:hypothetical protein